MKRTLIVFALASGLAACSAALTPPEVVQLSAEAEGQPVLVTMDLRVAQVGRDNGVLYINANEDYRDQRNVSLAVLPQAQNDFIAQHGPVENLIGRRLRARGWARRETIQFVHSRRPTGLYYFQTHLFIHGADQVELLD